MTRTPFGTLLTLTSFTLTSVGLARGPRLGLQLRLNGSSGPAGRGVKPIWSDADTQDGGANDPSLFGRLMVREIGSTRPGSIRHERLRASERGWHEPFFVLSGSFTGASPGGLYRGLNA